MNRSAQLQAAFDAHHQRRKRQEREFGLWLAGFCLTQSLRLGIWILLAVFGYALFSGDWGVFSVGNVSSGVAIVGLLGTLVAWRKIQAA